jgi:hypothetical protein
VKHDFPNGDEPGVKLKATEARDVPSPLAHRSLRMRARADCRAAIHHSSKASRQWTQWPALAPPRLLLRLLNQPIERVPQFEG